MTAQRQGKFSSGEAITNYGVTFIEELFGYVINMNKKIADYFNAEKRQLSSQSGKGGDPKKQYEKPTIVDDVFKEGLQNPDCLVTLLMFLRNLETQVNTVFKESASPRKVELKARSSYKN